MSRHALVVGITGIVGNNLARQLVGNNWQVSGLARRPESGISGVTSIAADLLNVDQLRAALENVRPTHVFLCTWLRQNTEAENIRVNSSMIRNVLDVLSPQNSAKHVGLVTGLKHYLGPFGNYAEDKDAIVTPFRETQPRLPVENFYYNQEDEVFAAAARDGFTWSIHRPHTTIGYALGNAMNIGLTLAVYATICRETGRPFIFPGSAVQWNGLTDMTDARLLGKHIEWAAVTPAAHNEAFNVVDGDTFRWKWMWSRIAEWFGIVPAPMPGEATPLEAQLADAAPIWRQIASKHNLIEEKLERLSTAWHTDLDLGRPIECVTDMTKSRKLGFTEYQATDEAFFDVFSQLVQERIIPGVA